MIKPELNCQIGMKNNNITCYYNYGKNLVSCMQIVHLFIFKPSQNCLHLTTATLNLTLHILYILTRSRQYLMVDILEKRLHKKKVALYDVSKEIILCPRPH